MKHNKSLFEKRIDLKCAQVFGGRLAGTHTETSTSTHTNNCTDTKTTIKTDSGSTIQTCTDYTCP
ncbi:hypothetical protein [Pedobacter sp. JY14-1]|uniref:hypothetical protein n=1 Tax=Pedobacter sp. JY14-1 TaxID=3034151 RepID=UPI0023E11A24|nr:hypothetical protein [Pedobacter sp. JY14-1]